jgi:hypothetical protein
MLAFIIQNVCFTTTPYTLVQSLVHHSHWTATKLVRYGWYSEVIFKATSYIKPYSLNESNLCSEKRIVYNFRVLGSSIFQNICNFQPDDSQNVKFQKTFSLLCILCSLLFCDIVILCVTIFLLYFVLFIFRVLYCVCLWCTWCYPNWGFSVLFPQL